MQPNIDTLTVRENEITERISKGQTNREIAEALFISPHTVRNHVQNIFQKLEIKNQRQLVSLYSKLSKKEAILTHPQILPSSRINRNKIICGCQQISAGDIEQLYSRGIITMKSLVEETCLGLMCRNCVKEAADLMQTLSLYR
jgi:DNA-binding CsgD family transcriptional regulator/bacterioferritin-associated ferredoxin